MTGIPVGISTCLLGKEVRHDGGHKHSRFCTQVLSRHFEFRSICPELEAGLGVPRPAIHLREYHNSLKLIETKGTADHTDAMQGFIDQILPTLGDLRGYILMAKSPSCGMERIKVHNEDGNVTRRDGRGLFAEALIRHYPLMPVEEEGRLNDPVLRDNFIERVLCFHRWQQLQNRGITAARLIDFHSCHKLLVLSHGVVPYRALGRLVADTGKHDIYKIADDYIQRLMRALKRKATRRSHANVLQHLQGYLKRALDRSDRQELVEVIDHYRLGRVPLVVPMTLLRHHFRRHPDPYITRQIYLNPHPPELMLRNLI